MGRPRMTGIYIRYCPYDPELGKSALEKGSRFNYADVPEYIHTGFIPNGCILEYDGELYLLYNRSLVWVRYTRKLTGKRINRSYSSRSILGRIYENNPFRS